MKLLSIDIETLGTDPTSLILAMGYCIIDTETRAITEPEKIVLDADSIAADIDLSTLRWWLSTPALVFQLKEYLEDENAESVAGCAVRLHTYMATNKVTHVLVKSNSFEMPMINNMFEKMGITNPLKTIGFRNVVDVRTLEIVSHKKKLLRDPALTMHCPLMDAKYQALNFLYLTKE